MDIKKRADSLKIGELAELFGLTARTIRYYEELGLLKSDDRTEGLHRRYPEINLIYLRRIRQLKADGLSLGQIKEFFELAEKDPTGELCKAMMVHTYQDRIHEEEVAIEKAQLRLATLKAQVEALQQKRGFFSCPGEACVDCDTPCPEGGALV